MEDTKKFKQKKEFRTGRLITLAIVVLFISVIVLGSFYTISAGYRGVLLTFGKPSDNIMEEGLHFKIPIVQSVKKMEVRTQKVEVGANAASKDLQDVQTTIALNFHLDPNEVNTLYQEIGTDYLARVINPAIQESVKAIEAQYQAEELITQRAKVRDGIKEMLTERLAKYYIKVDDFNIVDFQFSVEFDNAIEAKVTAEQLKLKAEMDLERIMIEAEQKVTQAQAEADSLRLQKQQITPDLLTLRAIEKWNGVMPLVTGDAIPLLGMNIGENNYISEPVNITG